MRNKVRTYIMGIVVIVAIVLMAGRVTAEPINQYNETSPIVTVYRADGYNMLQQSALFDINGNFATLANGGGQLVIAGNLLDHSTTIREVRYMNGCGDIEGATMVLVDGVSRMFFANEYPTATIHVMLSPSTARKCNEEGVETFTLIGLDEDRGRGIEGIAYHSITNQLLVVDQNQSVVKAFTYVKGTPVYEPITLFSLQSCSNLGDVAVRPNGNVIVICKAEGELQEYTINGDFISRLPIGHGQPEGVVEIGNQICVLGEPAQFQCFVGSGVVIEPPPPPPEPVYETCYASGTFIVDVDIRTVAGPVTITCETFNISVEL